MEKVRWKTVTIWTALTILCSLCYHGSFEPGSGAWLSKLRSTATIHGHKDTTKFDANAVTGERIQVYDGSGSGQSGGLSAHHNDSPTTDYQPSDSQLLTKCVQRRRLGLSIPSSKGWTPYALACVGAASIIAAVYGGSFGRKRWHTESEATISRRVPPAWGPHMNDYPLREWIRDLLDWCTLGEYHPPSAGNSNQKSATRICSPDGRVVHT